VSELVRQQRAKNAETPRLASRRKKFLLLPRVAENPCHAKPKGFGAIEQRDGAAARGRLVFTCSSKQAVWSQEGLQHREEGVCWARLRSFSRRILSTSRSPPGLTLKMMPTPQLSELAGARKRVSGRRVAVKFGGCGQKLTVRLEMARRCGRIRPRNVDDNVRGDAIGRQCPCTTPSSSITPPCVLSRSRRAARQHRPSESICLSVLLLFWAEEQTFFGGDVLSVSKVSRIVKPVGFASGLF
jgi:hypothetical protein